MGSKNRIIWNEGLFIKAHHFQQEAKYVENLVNQKVEMINDFLIGFQSLMIDQEYLSFGKVGIQSAKGVMPDGTLFDIPAETPPPDPLTINDTAMINQVIYLCVPLKSDGVTEISPMEHKGQRRYVQDTIEVKDTFSESGDYAKINVAQVGLKLMLEKDDRSSYNSLAIAKILDIRADNSVELDPLFYPVSLSLSAIPSLKKSLEQIAGLMRERSTYIGLRVGNPTQGGVADVTDFMMLTSLNRLHPLMIHLSKLNHLHPERLYSSLIEACGELSTFFSETKVPDEFAPYNHAQPHLTFVPLIRSMQIMLEAFIHPRAQSIAIVQQEFGIYSASFTPGSSISLVDDDFILAVKANASTESIRNQFTQQTKISSLDKIVELINLQLPGIPLISLPVAPRHLPYHAGFTYFQLDKNDPSWQVMQNSTGFAFHIAGAYQELEMEFWAIRSGN